MRPPVGQFNLDDMEFPSATLRKPIMILSQCLLFWGILVAGSVSIIAWAQDGSPASSASGWKRCQPLEEGASFAATVAGSDGRIYVITGLTGENEQFTSRNSAYDPQRNIWIELAPIPTPRSEPGTALGPEGKIYVIGGNPTRNRKQSS